MRQDINVTRRNNTYYLLERSRRLLHERRSTKHIGIRKKKRRKVGGTAQEQENRAQGVHSNKASRLCYKAEPGTLSYYLSSSFSHRQWYQVSLLPLSRPPSVNKSTKTKQNCQDSGAAATQVPLISWTGTLPHDLPYHYCRELTKNHCCNHFFFSLFFHPIYDIRPSFCWIWCFEISLKVPS